MELKINLFLATADISPPPPSSSILNKENNISVQISVILF